MSDLFLNEGLNSGGVLLVELVRNDGHNFLISKGGVSAEFFACGGENSDFPIFPNDLNIPLIPLAVKNFAVEPIPQAMASPDSDPPPPIR